VSGGTGAVTFTNNGVTSLAGTINQISVSGGGTGAVTLSLPQAINIGASPIFAGLTLSGFTTTVAYFIRMPQGRCSKQVQVRVVRYYTVEPRKLWTTGFGI